MSTCIRYCDTHIEDMIDYWHIIIHAYPSSELKRQNANFTICYLLSEGVADSAPVLHSPCPREAPLSPTPKKIAATEVNDERIQSITCGQQFRHSNGKRHDATAVEIAFGAFDDPALKTSRHMDVGEGKI